MSADSASAASDPVVRLAILDVGQGDTIVASVQEDREAVIIDCADAEAVFTYLESEGIDRVRGLILTHLHADHYRGIGPFLDGCEEVIGRPCERVMALLPTLSKAELKALIPSEVGPFEDDDAHSSDDSDPTTRKRERITAWRALQDWRLEHPTAAGLLVRQPGDRRGSLADGRIGRALELLYPLGADAPDLKLLGYNNLSGVIKVYGQECSALLTGDIQQAGWTRFIRQNGVPAGLIRSDVLKFPHHGAWPDADPRSLLDAIAPKVVVISVGTDGVRYGHPNDEVLAALAERPDIRVLCTEATDRCGHIDAQASDVLHRILHEGRDEAGSLATVKTLPMLTRQAGCPCAGPVIIDLAAQPQVLRPELNLHRDRIVLQHYTNHRCLA